MLRLILQLLFLASLCIEAFAQSELEQFSTDPLGINKEEKITLPLNENSCALQFLKTKLNTSGLPVPRTFFKITSLCDHPVLLDRIIINDLSQCEVSINKTLSKSQDVLIDLPIMEIFSEQGTPRMSFNDFWKIERIKIVTDLGVTHFDRNEGTKFTAEDEQNGNQGDTGTNNSPQSGECRISAQGRTHVNNEGVETPLLSLYSDCDGLLTIKRVVVNNRNDCIVDQPYSLKRGQSYDIVLIYDPMVEPFARMFGRPFVPCRCGAIMSLTVETDRGSVNLRTQ